MTLSQLHLVEKIKAIVTSDALTKKQVVAEVEKDATEHRLVNQRQEREDKERVTQATKELREETRIADEAYARLSSKLAFSIFLNLVFLLIIALAGYYIFYR